MTEHDNDHKVEKPHREEPPPILGRWRNLYALVLGFLVFLIVAFLLFTMYWS